MRVLPSLLPGLLAALVITAPHLASSPASVPPLRAVSGEQVVLTQTDTPAGEVERTYSYDVPTTGTGPRPLVLVLHGRAQTVDSLQQTSGIVELGEEQGFVSAFPTGYGGVWNSGTCCAARSTPDMPDVAFLDQVVDDVSSRTSIDPTRLYVVGFSNGGMMAYRYACERPDRVAGVGIVSGSMSASPDYANAGEQRCRPARPVSVVAVHGASDTTVPYEGGAVAGSHGGSVAAVRGGVDQFAVADGCRAHATSRVGVSQRLDYSECLGGSAVRLVKLPGHGHGWTRDSRRFGYDTTAGVWAFLSQRRNAG